MEAVAVKEWMQEPWQPLNSTTECCCKLTCSTLDALAARCACGTYTHKRTPHCAGLTSSNRRMRYAGIMKGTKVLLSWLKQAARSTTQTVALGNATLSSSCSCEHQHSKISHIRQVGNCCKTVTVLQCRQEACMPCTVYLSFLVL